MDMLRFLLNSIIVSTNYFEIDTYYFNYSSLKRCFESASVFMDVCVLSNDNETK